jgi:predicted nucleotidyltransferase
MTTDTRVRKIILEIVDRIIKGYNPKKVILFGSYAYGEAREESDMDILIVTERNLSFEETSKMRRHFLKDFSMPVQLVCVSDEDFDETKDIIGGITYPASKYGEILYEKP